MVRQAASPRCTIAFYGELEGDRAFRIRFGAAQALKPGCRLVLQDYGPSADCPEESSAAPPWAEQAAGVLVDVSTAGNAFALAEWCRQGLAATVSTCGQLLGTPVPVVTIASRQLAGLAADHLGRICGCRSFVHLGYALDPTSVSRESAFQSELAAAGQRCHALRTEILLAEGWGDASRLADCGLADLLERLSRPIGVFAINDAYAAATLRLCRQAGLRVPADVAVLGVGNSALTHLHAPKISSIQVDYRALGSMAMRTLQAMLETGASSRDTVFLPVGRLIARESTIGPREDWRSMVVDRALHAINERFSDPLSVTSVARSLGISRRLLELVFQEDRGMTPREEIQRVRFAAAIRMLKQTDLPITQVAFQVGFSEPATLSKMVYRHSGRTPSYYRSLRRGTPGNA